MGDRRMKLEHWWNDTDKAKRNCSKINLSQCHMFHHNPHMNCSAPEPGPLHWETGEHRVSHDMVHIVVFLVLTPCNELGVNECFGEAYYICLQDVSLMAMLLCTVCLTCLRTKQTSVNKRSNVLCTDFIKYQWVMSYLAVPTLTTPSVSHCLVAIRPDNRVLSNAKVCSTLHRHLALDSVLSQIDAIRIITPSSF